VPPFALSVCQPADGEEIRGLEQPDALGEIKALATIELLRDIEETGRGETGKLHLVIG
jgi:hypothetical protein